MMRPNVQLRTQAQCTPNPHLRGRDYAGGEHPPALWRTRAGAGLCHPELPRLLWLPWSPVTTETAGQGTCSQLSAGAWTEAYTSDSSGPDVLAHRSFDLVERTGALSDTSFVFNRLIASWVILILPLD